jgi:hypothetical protein
MFSEAAPHLKTPVGSPAYAAPEMVVGNSYTQAADVWSLGVLLYAIVVGYLPFVDPNTQRLLHKVVYGDVEYPPFLSPQLVDLLQKMICKDPNTRITIAGIKHHPWFSATEYRGLLHEADPPEPGFEDESAQERSIDSGIVAKMIGMKVDCRHLHGSLLTGESTELTALYRMLHRDKLTEQNRDLMARIGRVSDTIPLHQTQRPKAATVPILTGPSTARAPEHGGLPAIAGVPHVAAQGSSRAPPKGLLAGSPPPALQLRKPLNLAEGSAAPGSRRMSRPLVVRTPPLATAGMSAHETP